MAKKLTYEFVKESFEKEGYTLLSTDYTSATTKLDFVCNNGHTHSIKWAEWNGGHRCFYCSNNGKPDYNVIKKSFEDEGYELLSDVYINNKTKLKYRCPQEHVHEILWTEWRRGRRCWYCFGTPKLTYEYVRSTFIEANYTLISTTYENIYSNLEYICDNGHHHSMIWINWRKGSRCPSCRDINRFGSGNSNYQGGKSLEKYCEIWKDKEYKADIRERDGHRCLNPYCTSTKADKLNIHHIDYDKQNCHPKNLITVCRECNIKANYNRTWHTAWYQTILYRRYGYVYEKINL